VDGWGIHSPSRPQPGQWGRGLRWARRLLSNQFSAAFFLSGFSRRCTVECCFIPNCSGCLSLSRPTMASAVSCGSAASQFSSRGRFQICEVVGLEKPARTSSAISLRDNQVYRAEPE
jgi:hypothetical protein